MADKEEEGKVCGTDRKRAGGPDGAALPVTKKIKKNLSDEMMNETTAYIKDDHVFRVTSRSSLLLHLCDTRQGSLGGTHHIRCLA
jgi:hypothetical protein